MLLWLQWFPLALALLPLRAHATATTPSVQILARLVSASAHIPHRSALYCQRQGDSELFIQKTILRRTKQRKKERKKEKSQQVSASREQSS